ncbi:MAG: hypothetical protein RJB58_1452 [Pseudomonadota bacterium]|jgi:hypothetical protein
MLACPLCGNDVTAEIGRALENVAAENRGP